MITIKKSKPDFCALYAKIGFCLFIMFSYFQLTISFTSMYKAGCYAEQVWMYFFLDNVATQSGHNIWTFVGKENTSLFAIFIANFSLWTELAVDIPNLTRYLKVESGTKNFFKRNKNIFAAQLIALPVISTLLALIGAISYVGTGDWNPITVIQHLQTDFKLVLLLGLVVLAQWSTNNAANLILAALAFVNLGAPKLSYRNGVILAGIIGTVSMPWAILNNLTTFLGYYGGALSAVAGVMFSDYYLIRRRRLNVADLYSVEGQFRFTKWINPAGLIPWVVGGGLAIWQLLIAYFVGFPVGVILYYLLMKFWVMPKFPQAEVISNHVSCDSSSKLIVDN
jgi:nucleobase:cation symporter-1, NCS1 family